MNSFRELYCAKHVCRTDEFAPRLLWRCLPWKAKLLALALGGTRARHFQPDHELIASVASATTRHEVSAHLSRFLNASENRSWARSQLRLRISTGMLQSVAFRYLPRHAPKSIDAPEFHVIREAEEPVPTPQSAAPFAR